MSAKRKHPLVKFVFCLSVLFCHPRLTFFNQCLCVEGLLPPPGLKVLHDAGVYVGVVRGEDLGAGAPKHLVAVVTPGRGEEINI